MLDQHYSAPPKRSLWPRVNLACFALAHLALVYGVRNVTHDYFISLMTGIVAGLLAYSTWRLRLVSWDMPVLSVIFLGSAGVIVSISLNLSRPPPDPPRLEIVREADDKWWFNRGGDHLVGRYYMVLPETETPELPFVLGAVRVVPGASYVKAPVKWVSRRERHLGASHYFVRPLRPGERNPMPASMATLISRLEGNRGRIDLGRGSGVQVQDAYVLHNPAGPKGSGGFFVVEEIDETSSEGFLVEALEGVGHDLDFYGRARDLAVEALTRGDLARRAGDLEAARKSWSRANLLTGGSDPRITERLKALETLMPASSASPDGSKPGHP